MSAVTMISDRLIKHYDARTSETLRNWKEKVKEIKRDYIC